MTKTEKKNPQDATLANISSEPWGNAFHEAKPGELTMSDINKIIRRRLKILNDKQKRSK